MAIASKLAKKILILPIVLLIFFVGIISSLAFTFTGYTYNITQGPLNNTNVSVEVRSMGMGGPPTLIGVASNLSTANGSFTVDISGALDDSNYMYKPVIKHYSGAYVDYIGQALPDFPRAEMQNLGSINFFLKEGVTINITASGEPSTRENTTITQTWQLNNSVISGYNSPQGLEWNNNTQKWAYLALGSPNSLIVVNSDFTDNNTYDLNNFFGMKDLDIVNNTWHYIISLNETSNKSQVRKYSFNNTGSFVLNQTYNLSQNYTYISTIEYNIVDGFFYVLGQNTTNQDVFDRYYYNSTSELFVLNRTSQPGVMGRFVMASDNQWYGVSESSASSLMVANNELYGTNPSSACNFSGRGIEQKNGETYILTNNSEVFKVEVFDDGSKSFNYMIKDVKLGYPISENFDSAVQQATAYLPADRNYSIMIYPDRAFPVSFDLNNISDYTSSPKSINVHFNTSEEWKWVSGYAKVGGVAGFSNLSIITFLLEPGNMLAKDHPLPNNLGAMRTTAINDTTNGTTGFFNVTLPGAAMGANMLMFAIAQNGSNYYGGFRNITLTTASTDTVSFNITLQALTGSVSPMSVQVASSSGPMTSINVSVKQSSFVIQNSTGSRPNNAFVDVTLEYGSLSFSWMLDVSQEDNGTFTIPLLYDNVRRINVYTPDFAPQKISKVASDLLVQPVNLTMRNFDPGSIEEGQNISIFMDLFKSNLACDVPTPNRSACSLMPQGNVSEEQFNPLTAIIGGGKISFRMEDTSTGIVIYYTNVDMLASGPPDVLFDSDSNDTEAGSSLEQAWRFGSGGPEIYDKVIVGVPYNSSRIDENLPQRVLISHLYDENWASTWNSSDNPNGLNITAFPDYADFNQSWFNETAGGMACVGIGSFNASKQGCYNDPNNNMNWLVIPHFSGLGPQINSYAVMGNITSDSTVYSCYPSCSANITVNVTNSGLAGVQNITINNTALKSGITYGIEWLNGSQWVSAGQNNSLIQNYNLTAGSNEFRINISLPRALSTKWNFTIGINGTNYTLDPYVDSINLTSPSNGSTIGTGSRDFSFVLYSDVYSGQNCSLYLNSTSTVSASNGSVTNGSTTTLSGSVSAGHTYWFISCNTTGNSQVKYFSVDTIVPAVFDLRPGEGSIYNISSTINISANATDATAISSVRANITYPNSTSQLVTLINSTASFYNNTFTIPFLIGRYNITILANDTYNNVNSTATTYFTAQETVLPSISLNAPVNTFNTTSTSVAFNWTATDNYASSLTCNISINSIVNVSGVSSANNTATNYTITGFSDGTYYWNITCTDSSGNANISATRSFRVDTTSPAANYNATNASVAHGSAITVNTNWTESTIGTDNLTCKLYANNTLNQTHSTSTSWCNFTYTTTIDDYPSVILRVSATDSFNLTGNSANMSVQVNYSCGATVTKNLTLQRDMKCYSGSSEYAVDMGTGIVFNCAGYTITGNGSGTGIIARTAVSSNFTIIGCTVRNFTKGIGFNSGTTNNVIDSCSIDNTTQGIDINSSGHTIKDVNISSSTGLAINVTAATTWNITTRNKIINNNITFNGTLNFGSSGVLELAGSYLTLNGTLIQNTGNVTSLQLTTSSVAANTSTELNFQSSTSSNISLVLANGVNVTIAVSKETPSSAPSGYSTLKGIDISVNSATSGNLTYALIKIFYNSSELTAANVEESSLKIYYYNTTAGAWQLEPTQGVDTTNDYIWANVTHFSDFGVFGTAPATTTSTTTTTTTSSSTPPALTTYTITESDKSEVFSQKILEQLGVSSYDELTVTKVAESSQKIADGSISSNLNNALSFSTEDAAKSLFKELIAKAEENKITKFDFNHNFEVYRVKVKATGAATYVSRVSISQTANEDMAHVELIRVIPKSAAESASKIVFSPQASIIQDDPIVRWAFDDVKAGETISAYYVVASKISRIEDETVSFLGDKEIKEIVEDAVPQQLTEESKEPVAEKPTQPARKISASLISYILIVVVAITLIFIFIRRKKMRHEQMQGIKEHMTKEIKKEIK